LKKKNKFYLSKYLFLLEIKNWIEIDKISITISDLLHSTIMQVCQISFFSSCYIGWIYCTPENNKNKIQDYLYLWFRESAVESKDRFFGDRCYFIYDRPTFAVNLQRFDRGRIACSSRVCISNPRRYDWTHVARVIPQNSRGTDRWRWHADPAIFDLSKCIRLCYPEGYIYPLPIQTNGLDRDRAGSVRIP